MTVERISNETALPCIDVECVCRSRMLVVVNKSGKNCGEDF